MYRRLWTCGQVSGPAPIVWQPILMLGPGRIELGSDVEFGWPTSMGFYSGYCHIEAASPEAVVTIGDGVQINNSAVIKSEGPGIRIGARGLIGSQVCIYDSDFHELHPQRRRGGRPAMGEVVLEENVFVGDGARILKGVRVGRDAVIGAGSVVTSSVAPGVIVAGNPAREVRAVPGFEDTAARGVA
jgi:acetyltransferase-like isoleucine patch superfamily enzyme